MLCCVLPATPVDAAEQSAAPVEEVLVEAVRQCGSWPVGHTRTRDCLYARVKDNQLARVLALREPLLDSCLICDHKARQCRRRPHSRDQRQLTRLCKHVFWTPTQLLTAFDWNDLISEGIDVSFSYRISTLGEVEGVTIIFLAGWNERDTRRMIREGSRRARFEPLLIDGKAYAIVDLEENYILEE